MEVCLQALLVIWAILRGTVSLPEYNLYHLCDERISMISDDTKGALLYYERTTRFNGYYSEKSRSPCTVELWGWFENDIAMHFRSFNMTNSDTHVEIRQGDSWIEARPIEGMPTRFSGTSLEQLNHVYTSDWMDIFIRIGGDLPPYDTKIFELALNVFHTGLCKSWEFSCDNGWCIDKDLKCNGYDNPCGDSSDCQEPGVSSGVIAVICVSVASGGSAILTFVYYCGKSLRKKQRRQQADAQSVARRQGPTDVDLHDINGVTDADEQQDHVVGANNYNNSNSDITDLTNRNHTNRDEQIRSAQRYGYVEPSAYSREPPSYHSVLSDRDRDRSGVNNVHEVDNSDSEPHPPGYNQALAYDSLEPSAPAEEGPHDNSASTGLPSYLDVLQNEDAYRVNLEEGRTIEYTV